MYILKLDFDPHHMSSGDRKLERWNGCYLTVTGGPYDGVYHLWECLTSQTGPKIPTTIMNKIGREELKRVEEERKAFVSSH